MPIYAYKCAACGHEQEVLQKMSDAPLTDCAQCGRPSLTKQVTAAGFQLKGTGWYATDFRNKGSGKPAEDRTDSNKADSNKADSSKTDSSKTDSGKTESANDANVDAPASDKKPSASAHSCGSGGCSACS
jgi:putative FmdB family regulatory protein